MASPKSRKLIGSLLIFTMCMAISGAIVSLSKAEASLKWMPLSEIISRQQLVNIVAENTAPSADRDEIAGSAIGYKQDDLLVVDFQSTTLCGVGGCAVAAYQVSTGDRILFTYANRASSSSEIAKIIESEDANTPCLQLSFRGERQPETLCYTGREWNAKATL